MTLVRITLTVTPETKQEVDRYKARMRFQFPKQRWDTETTAAALLTAWANAQQRKRTQAPHATQPTQEAH